MMLSGILVVFVAFNMALDIANGQFYVDIEHSMPRIGKRDQQQLNTHYRPQLDQQDQQQQQQLPQGVVSQPQRGVQGAEETNNRANNVALLRQILSLMNENLQSQIETAAADSAYAHPYYSRFRPQPTNDGYSDKTFRLIKYLRKKIQTLQQKQQQEQQFEN